MITKNGVINSATFYENGTNSTYSITGTLTDNDGVFSGFSTANYLMTNCSISCTSDKLEFYGTYTTTSDITTEQYIFATSTRNLALTVINSKFRLQTYANNNWTLVVGTTALSANTKYYFKIISDNTTIKLYVLVNGLWVQNASITLPATQTTSLIGLGVLPPNTSPYAKGTINIKDFSVRVSGKEVWSGLDAYYPNSNPKINKNYIAGHVFQEI